MTAFDRRARVGSGEIGFIAVVVVEPKQPCPNFETSRALRKPAPIRAAPELPVSDDLEPERLLQTHNLADAVILNTRKLVFPNLLGSAALESFPQGWRTQQASDVVGAIRGPALRAHGHRSGQDKEVRACCKTAWSQDLRPGASQAIACAPAPEIAALVLHEPGEHQVVHLGGAVHQACLAGIAVNPLQDRVL